MLRCCLSVSHRFTLLSISFSIVGNQKNFHFHHPHWLSFCHARAITCSGNNLTFPAPYWETKSSAGLVFAVPAFCRSGLTGRVADSVCGEGMSSGRLLGKLASTTRVYLTLLRSLSSARALASRCLVHLSFLPSGRGEHSHLRNGPERLAWQLSCILFGDFVCKSHINPAHKYTVSPTSSSGNAPN